MEVGRGGGAQNRPKLERWYVFRMGHVSQTSPIQGGIAFRMYFMCRWHIKQTKMSKMQPLRQKYDQKFDPFARKCVGECSFERCRKSHPFTRNSVENATPQAEMQRRNAKNITPSFEIASKMRPLKQKVRGPSLPKAKAALASPTIAGPPALQPLSLCYN